MKISIFLEAFEPEFWGGRETRWSRLIPEIAKAHEITIFGDFSSTKPTIAFPNVDCSFVNIGPLPNMYSSKGVRSLRHAFAYTWQCRSLLHHKADIILTDQTPLIAVPILRAIAFLLKSDFSVTWHEIWSLETWNKYSKKTGFIGVVLQTVALISSKNIVLPSESVFMDLQKKIFSKHAIVIPKGIDESVRTIAECGVATKSDTVKLLYVGRLIKHKNCDFLLQIMLLSVAEGKKWHLTIVGAGPMAIELASSVRRLNLSHWVTLKSNLSKVELANHYGTSDVFVFPSEREGFGISVSEALSNNLPAIVYNVPENAATKMISSDLLGRKINSLDPRSWMSAIDEILERDTEVKIGVFISGLLSWKIVGSQYLEFLNSIENRH